MGILPSIDQTRVVDGTPAEIFDAFHVWCLLIEVVHALPCEKFECFAVSSSVWEKIEKEEDLWKTVFAD